jgi:hypothetical protein
MRESRSGSCDESRIGSVIEQPAEARLFFEAARHDAIGDVRGHREHKHRERQPGDFGVDRDRHGRHGGDANTGECICAGQP